MYSTLSHLNNHWTRSIWKKLIVSIDYQWCPHDTKVTHIEESYFTLSVSKGGHLYLREMLGEVDCI